MNMRTRLVFLAITTALTSCVLSPQPPSSPPTAIAPLPTSPPSPTPATTMFTNEDVGFSFRFPSEYHMITYSGGSLCLTLAQLDGRPSSCHVANAYIETRNAEGQTLQDLADAIASQGNPTVPVLRTPIEIGNEPALLLDDIYTYDVLRKVVVIHGALIVELTFLPWGEGSGEFPTTQSLYTIVTDSFTFLER